VTGGGEKGILIFFDHSFKSGRAGGLCEIIITVGFSSDHNPRERRGSPSSYIFHELSSCASQMRSFPTHMNPGICGK